MHFEYLKHVGLASGHIADVGLGEIEISGKRTPVVFKTARTSEDSDLMYREYEILDLLRKGLTKSDWQYTVPQVFGCSPVLYEDESEERVTNVLEFFPGFVSAADIRKLTVIDAKTAVWMWKRLLKLIDWVQHLGFVHGAILPPHVLYFPDNLGIMDQRTHAVRLVDWCYAVTTSKDQKLRAWVPEYAHHYPPEVLRKKPISPGTDLYMGAKLMLYLLGGDVRKDVFPDTTPKSIATHFMTCLAYDIRNRPKPRVAFDEFVTIAEQCYGKPQFHKFLLPGIGGL